MLTINGGPRIPYVFYVYIVITTISYYVAIVTEIDATTAANVRHNRAIYRLINVRMRYPSRPVRC